MRPCGCGTKSEAQSAEDPEETSQSRTENREDPMVNFVRGGTRIYAAVEGRKNGLESGPAGYTRLQLPFGAAEVDP
jgi:hypothetical protein